jgi:CheY-like chemotaxis protein
MTDQRRMTLTGLRVLVVEDEPIIAMMLEDCLGDLGCSVTAVASRLNDALKQARALDLDVGVLDVNLAGELSYPVAEVLRERAVPFVFATGYGTDATPASLKSAPVLSKPYRVEQLAKILLEICHR